MKIIGLIGGMSWESSLVYYRLLNERTKELLGPSASSECLMYSVDFKDIAELQHQGNWNELNNRMADAAKRLYKGGADIVVLCTNTMHLCEASIQEAAPIPFMHIADVTGQAIKKQGLSKVGLLGTRYTMEKDFYKKTLLEKHGIETIIPSKEERDDVHNIIYNELIQGTISDSSRERYIEIIQNLKSRGAEGVILGCTEIPLLIKQEDSPIPVFDTTTIHAHAAVDWAVF